MVIKKEKKSSYFKLLIRYYFRPVWESFFTILYLVFFAYFLVFNAGKLWIAVKFVVSTFFSGASILTITYLFWGVTFIITLIIPFSISLYAIIIFYEIWGKSTWEKYNKTLATIAIILAVPLVIILMDDITRTAGTQSELLPFIQENELRI
ncbi:MAG: hypothetical protein WD003_02800 [Candidatus Paceibacterota bacterium]